MKERAFDEGGREGAQGTAGERSQPARQNISGKEQR